MYSRMLSVEDLTSRAIRRESDLIPAIDSVSQRMETGRYCVPRGELRRWEQAVALFMELTRILGKDIRRATRCRMFVSLLQVLALSSRLSSIR